MIDLGLFARARSFIALTRGICRRISISPSDRLRIYRFVPSIEFGVSDPHRSYSRMSDKSNDKNKKEESKTSAPDGESQSPIVTRGKLTDEITSERGNSHL